MADTIKVPGIKNPMPKWAVYGGLAGVGVLIVVYYRKQQNAAAGSSTAAAGTAAAGAYPPDGTTGNPSDPYSTDPATGETYGDEAASGIGSGVDSGVLSGDLSDSYPWDGSYDNPSDPYSMDSSTGQTYGDEGYYGGYGSGLGTSGSGVSGPPFSTNQQWAAYAEQQLGAAGGIDTALGLYLEGKTLTATQESHVYAAIGVAGPVPVAAANGYPPNLRTASTGKKKGGTTYAKNPVSGLKVTGDSSSSISISWDKSEDATGYQVSVQNETAHRGAASTTTSATSWTARGLAPGDQYQIKVTAKPAEKGAQAATITHSTPRTASRSTPAAATVSPPAAKKVS